MNTKATLRAPLKMSLAAALNAALPAALPAALTAALTVALAAALLTVGALLPRAAAASPAPQVVTLDAASPLVEVRILFRAGSANDPAGKEGLAALTANALLEGGYTAAGKTVTKEELARTTRRWGSDANPSVRVGKEATTFMLVVPRDVLDEYRQKVLQPLFTQPLFANEEIDRLRNEALTQLTGPMRYEDIEMLGLEALDDYVFSGTSRGHAVMGSVEGLKAIAPSDIRSFYATYFKPENMILGIGSNDPKVVENVRAALLDMGKLPGQKVAQLRPTRPAPAPQIQGREMTIVALPDAPAVGLHLGFPIDVTRESPDFWPLYVANVYFGTHRDDHGVLYQDIRQARGYNYGDYSYIEHFANRPRAMFPPFNTPRSQQYFSIWIRPVADAYATHIAKAMTWELENLWRNGVPPEEVERSKNKAKVLYLNLAETSSRLLAAKMDDAYYGENPGYLESYVQHIEAVTPEQVNAAIRRHLSPDNIKYVIVAKKETAQKVADQIRADTPAWGKSPEDYQITVTEKDGQKVYEVPEQRLHVLQMDAVWANTRLGIDPKRVRVVPVEALFQSGAFISDASAAASSR